MRTLLALCLLSVASPLLAVDKSTYTFNSGMNCQGVWRLPDTGQTASYTATFGEDHDYQPAAVQMSYTVLNPVGISSVTVDNVTGLMWVTNPNTDAGFSASGGQTWEVALTSCTVTINDMAYAGYSDWRMPNIHELISIYYYGSAGGVADPVAFPGYTLARLYWSSTTDMANTNSAYAVQGDIPRMGSYTKTTKEAVRCVRGGK